MNRSGSGTVTPTPSCCTPSASYHTGSARKQFRHSAPQGARHLRHVRFRVPRHRGPAQRGQVFFCRGRGTLKVVVGFRALPRRENRSLISVIREGAKRVHAVARAQATTCVLYPRRLSSNFARTLLVDGIPRLSNFGGEASGRPIIARATAASRSHRDRFTWAHVAFIRRHWSEVLLIKGVLSADDARLTRDAGVDGLVVSNRWTCTPRPLTRRVRCRRASTEASGAASTL